MCLQLHQLLSHDDQIICASSITLSKIRNLFRNRKKLRVKSFLMTLDKKRKIVSCSLHLYHEVNSDC
jgi:hypothetical protein